MKSRSRARDPQDDVLEYAHPLTAGPSTSTIGSWLQTVPPGQSTNRTATQQRDLSDFQAEGAMVAGPKKTPTTKWPRAAVIACSFPPGTGITSRTAQEIGR